MHGWCWSRQRWPADCSPQAILQIQWNFRRLLPAAACGSILGRNAWLQSHLPVHGRLASTSDYRWRTKILQKCGIRSPIDVDPQTMGLYHVQRPCLTGLPTCYASVRLADLRHTAYFYAACRRRRPIPSRGARQSPSGPPPFSCPMADRFGPTARRRACTRRWR